ncbi:MULTISPECIES: hypothetical protein [Actinomadura]|uniref:Uncharacterized protein n=1 Tax=Actinomadura citrea TaxID=46158 RepID=A0A7Y9K9Y6_9ACTN|nr:hypothetical protein [Actinomadura citrea]NYE11227.1 hypothetical protein [Actinomadura citrea]GGT77778.1 hypothetical protein GCM10010177_40220 [Actinomadura citrea]
MPANAMPADKRPPDKRPPDQGSAGQRPFDQPPADQRPADRGPIDRRPADPWPGDHRPPGEPAGRRPADPRRPPDYYREDGRRATAEEAQRLLLDVRGRLLAQDVIRVGSVVVVVSTWFTVIDLGIAANGRPLLWQTIVSDHAMHADIGQYTARDKALRGHAQAVAMITSRLRGLVARAALDEAHP